MKNVFLLMDTLRFHKKLEPEVAKNIPANKDDAGGVREMVKPTGEHASFGENDFSFLFLTFLKPVKSILFFSVFYQSDENFLYEFCADRFRNVARGFRQWILHWYFVSDNICRGITRVFCKRENNLQGKPMTAFSL